jgi:hypothetical protein
VSNSIDRISRFFPLLLMGTPGAFDYLADISGVEP